jgi:CubicO group peptidase (beta-lactamase class C family)
MKINIFKLVIKILLRISLGIAVLFVLMSLVAFLIYPSEYVLRAICWGDGNVYDYQKFPERRLETSSQIFCFSKEVDESRIEALFEDILKNGDLDTFLADNYTQAFIVIQDGTILYEKYYNDTKRNSIVTSFSGAKSFTSALIGIAIMEGYIGSVNDSITKYLPELADRDSRFKDITIRHLLMMSSGIRYSENTIFVFGDDPKIYYYPNLRELAFNETKITEPPGKHFLYNGYNSLLLGMIIERACGTSVTHYLQEKIWKPLGMEFSGSWSIDSNTSGFELMQSGINARAIDFAKFGQLYLNKGNWGSKQVIPTDWIIESTQRDTSDVFYFADNQRYYKYMWWGLPRGENEYDFVASGAHGQIIYISPHKNLVIVRNGEQYGLEGLSWIDIFFKIASAI